MEAAHAEQYQKLFRQIMARIPSFTLESYRRARPRRAAATLDADAIVKGRIGRQQWTFVVLEAVAGHPRIVRDGVLRLEHVMRGTDHQTYGLILAPFVSDASAHICSEAGMGWADLSGNARLAFGQVYIELRSADRPHRERRELRSVFAAKAGRILRVMLTPPIRSWRVEELAAQARVSLGLVSKVRRRLLEEEWAVTDADGLRIARCEAVADAWRDALRNDPPVYTSMYTPLHGAALEAAVKSSLHEAGMGANALLAGTSAARWLAPHLRDAALFLQADAVGSDILQQHLHLEPVVRGGNVFVSTPHDDDVFSARVEAAPGIWCTSPLHTWLDLSRAGGRADEAADHLLRTILIPAWRKSEA